MEDALQKFSEDSQLAFVMDSTTVEFVRTITLREFILDLKEKNRKLNVALKYDEQNKKRKSKEKGVDFDPNETKTKKRPKGGQKKNSGEKDAQNKSKKKGNFITEALENLKRRRAKKKRETEEKKRKEEERKRQTVIKRFDMTINFIYSNIIRENQSDYPLFEFEFTLLTKKWKIRRTFEDFKNLLRKFKEKDEALATVCLDNLSYNGDQLVVLLQTIFKSLLVRKKIMFFHHFIEFSFINIGNSEEKIYKQTFVEKQINTKKQSIFQKMLCCDMSIPRWLVVTSEGIGYATRNDSSLSGFREFSYFFKKIRLGVNHKCHLEIIFEMRKLKVMISKELVFLDTLSCIMDALLESPGLSFNRFGSFSQIKYKNKVKFFVNGSDVPEESLMPSIDSDPQQAPSRDPTKNSQNPENEFKNTAREPLNSKKVSYFEELYDELLKAENEVFINDWFFSPHIFLKRPVEAFPESRLDKVLTRLAQKGVNVYIILYKEIDLVLYNKSGFVKTYLNRLHKNIRVVRHRSLNELISAWSHHEKMVIIDSRVLFMGGLDLAFGRTELPGYPLQEPRERTKNIYREVISDYIQRLRKEIAHKKRRSMVDETFDPFEGDDKMIMAQAKQLVKEIIIQDDGNQSKEVLKEKQLGVDKVDVPSRTPRRIKMRSYDSRKDSKRPSTFSLIRRKGSNLITLTSSRKGSRPPSRKGSRPTSRKGSRAPSRKGSRQPSQRDSMFPNEVREQDFASLGSLNKQPASDQIKYASDTKGMGGNQMKIKPMGMDVKSMGDLGLKGISESNETQTEEERRKQYNKINPFMVPKDNRTSLHEIPEQTVNNLSGKKKESQVLYTKLNQATRSPQHSRPNPFTQPATPSNNPFLKRNPNTDPNLTPIREEKEPKKEEYLHIQMEDNFRDMMDPNAEMSEMSFSEITLIILERILNKINTGENVMLNLDILSSFQSYCPIEVYDVLLKLHNMSNEKETFFFGQDFYNTRLKDFREVDKWNFCLLDKYSQPRMPWRDIALKAEGAIVSQMKRHFLKFWNFTNIEFGMKKATRRRKQETKQLLVKKHDKFSMRTNIHSERISLNSNSEFLKDISDMDPNTAFAIADEDPSGFMFKRAKTKTDDSFVEEQRMKNPFLMNKPEVIEEESPDAEDDFNSSEEKSTHNHRKITIELADSSFLPGGQKKENTDDLFDGIPAEGDDMKTPLAQDDFLNPTKPKNYFHTQTDSRVSGINDDKPVRSHRTIGEKIQKSIRGVKNLLSGAKKKNPERRFSEEPVEVKRISKFQKKKSTDGTFGKLFNMILLKKDSDELSLSKKSRKSKKNNRLTTPTLSGISANLNSDDESEFLIDKKVPEDGLDLELSMRTFDTPQINFHMNKMNIKHFNYSTDIGHSTCQGLRSSCRWSLGLSNIERSIYLAYLHNIKEAKHFILIENQFFISSTGGPKVKNKIAYVLAKRICKAIEEEKPFLAVILIPLLPGFEGNIVDNSTHLLRIQVYWHMMTIFKSDTSLYNLIVNHFYKCRKRFFARPENASATHSSYYGSASKEPRPDSIFNRFVKIYSLRNHDDIKGRPVTELIYIHSKLMIVDDRIALIGSANINDRSLLGNRDSEIAMLIEDEDDKKVWGDIAGVPFKKSPSIRRLREEVLKSITGLHNENYEDPLHPKLWKMIDMQASINTLFYRKVFNCYPCDTLLTLDDVKKAQTLPINTKEYYENRKEVKGFIVHFPYKFLSEQKNLRKVQFNVQDLVVSEEVYI